MQLKRSITNESITYWAQDEHGRYYFVIYTQLIVNPSTWVCVVLVSNENGCAALKCYLLNARPDDNAPATHLNDAVSHAKAVWEKGKKRDKPSMN